MTKCGRCVKTVFIYGSVAVLFSLVAYGQYTAYVAVNGSPFEAKTEPEQATTQKEDPVQAQQEEYIM